MNKYDRRFHNNMVLDIEAIASQLAYDIGLAIVRKKGEILDTRSYVVNEIFKNGTLMNTAYYKEKIPTYEKGIGTEWEIEKFLSIREEIHRLIRMYNVKEVWAYNCKYDITGLDKTMKILTGDENATFFPNDVEYHCIWAYACNTILDCPKFFRACEKNNWLSPCGNVKTGAEIVYRYLTNNADFEERHTALSDVLIESEILTKCYKTRVSAYGGSSDVNNQCWKVPNKTYKKMRENA